MTNNTENTGRGRGLEKQSREVRRATSAEEEELLWSKFSAIMNNEQFNCNNNNIKHELQDYDTHVCFSLLVTAFNFVRDLNYVTVLGII